eukprot:TRINITY_DN2713_c0_g1_i1.p1 TRINITY_DN2713_c0_g1~~TRINITY_DN2713_c0_g1_i1.p1  ORF type:complete len:622 (+),score=147.03 TRINITY_DN2713_c0_g1_i1:72-1937(+)
MVSLKLTVSLFSVFLVVFAGLNPSSVDQNVHTSANNDRKVKLRSKVEIPQSGERTWVIDVKDDFDVESVAVKIDDLQHPHSKDLEIYLMHKDRDVNILNNDLDLPIGSKLRRTMHKSFYFSTPSDVSNIALGKVASQSSTGFGAVPERAIDGNVNGYFSEDSVTHTAGFGSWDPYPHWQVDLGSIQSIGTIKLWNRVQVPNVDEVQEIKLISYTTIKGYFQLEVNGAKTALIRVDAVATIAEEDDTAPPDTGSSVGESIQSKIQSLSAIDRVKVTQTASDSNGVHSWVVQFLSEPGNLPEMLVTSKQLTGVDADVVIKTIIEGSANVWTNYKRDIEAVTGRLVPSKVMILNTDEGNNDPTTASASAVWETTLSVAQRETTIIVPEGIQGQYVRIQLLTQTSALSLAEVEIFSTRTSPMSEYTGGSPIKPQSFDSASSLNHGFRELSSKGQWVLRLKDTRTGIIPSTEQNGSLDDWSLIITGTAGEFEEYTTDMFGTVKTLPKYGELYQVDTDGVTGLVLKPVVDQMRYLAPCLTACEEKYNVGNNLSTNESGDVAIPILLRSRMVLYRPTEDYLGEDSFTYTVNIGTEESPNEATVSLDILICRDNSDLCETEVFDDINVF